MNTTIKVLTTLTLILGTINMFLGLLFGITFNILFGGLMILAAMLVSAMEEIKNEIRSLKASMIILKVLDEMMTEKKKRK